MERERGLSSTFPLSLMHHVDDHRHTDHEPGGTLANVRSNLLMLHGKGVLHLESLLRHRLQLEVVFDLFLRVPVAATGHARAHAAAVSVSPRQYCTKMPVDHVMHPSPMRPRNRMCVCAIATTCAHAAWGHGTATTVAKASSAAPGMEWARLGLLSTRSWLDCPRALAKVYVYVHE